MEKNNEHHTNIDETPWKNHQEINDRYRENQETPWKH
jgi:hypothetical protein